MKKLLIVVASLFVFLGVVNAQTLDNVACKKLGETIIEKQENFSYQKSNDLYGDDFVKFCDCFFNEDLKNKTPESMMRVLVYIATIQGDEKSNSFQKLASMYRLEMNEPKNAKLYNSIITVIDKPVNQQNYEQDLLPIAEAMGLVDNELIVAKEMVAAQVHELTSNATYVNLLVDIIHNFSTK